MSHRLDKFGMSAELWALVILVGVLSAFVALGAMVVWLVATWAGVV